MTKRHLPSIETLTSADEERLTTELRLLEVRDQVTHAKELLDSVDLLDASSSSAGLAGKAIEGVALAEELARLGCRIVEIASAISKKQDLLPGSTERLRAANS